MPPTVQKLLQFINRAPFATGSLQVHGSRLHFRTLDRLLYLWLHRTGWMGRDGLHEVGLELRPGMTVVDVGANVGIYTALFSRLVGEGGRVISLEPAPENWRALSKSAEVNGWSNVEVHQVGAADRHDRMSLACSSYNSGNNSLEEEHGDSAVEVAVAPLDSIVAGRRVHYVKIDVQGWEAAVLRGAQDTLTRNRPIAVRVEIWPSGLRRANSSAQELLRIMQDYELRVDDADRQKLSDSAGGQSYFDITARA